MTSVQLLVEMLEKVLNEVVVLSLFEKMVMFQIVMLL